MEKTLIILIVLLLTTATYAKNIELKLSSIYRKDTVISKVNEVTISAKQGKEFIIPKKQGNPFKLKLKVLESKDGFIEISAKLFNFNDEIVTSSKVITRYGLEAMISTESTNADGVKESFDLKVVPIKK